MVAALWNQKGDRVGIRNNSLSFFWYIKGCYFQWKGKWKDAAVRYEHAVRYNAKHERGWYRLGYVYLKNALYEKAVSCFENAITLLPDNSFAHFRLGYSFEKQKKWQDALTCYDQAFLLQKDKKKEQWFLRKAYCLEKIGAKEMATNALHECVKEYPQSLTANSALHKYLLKKGQWWQLADHLNYFTEFHNDYILYYDLGMTCHKMKRFEAAAEAFLTAFQCKRNDEVLFRAGYSLERAGQHETAAQLYKRVMCETKNKDLATLGIGVYFQKNRMWPEAAKAYKAETVRQPHNDTLWLRLGYAQDLCCRWEEAAEAYRKSILLNAKDSYRHYRLGFLYERMGKWLDAAASYYKSVVFSTKHEEFRLYFLGNMLAKSEKYEEACHAYLQCTPKEQKNVSASAVKSVMPSSLSTELMFAGNSTSPELHYSCALLHEADEEWEKAVASYKAAIQRSDTHQPAWQYRLGKIFVGMGRFEEACASFRDMYISSRPPEGGNAKYVSDSTLWNKVVYTEIMETRPIIPDTVLYESFGGLSVSCNPYAIFTYLLDHPDYKHFTHIWIVADTSRIPIQLTHLNNVIFITKNSYRYIYYLATSQYLISNSTFPSFFIRRKEQRYLNTWHGTPLKYLGKDIKSPFMAHQNTVRNFLHATHIISPNAFTSKILLDRYTIENIYPGLFAETGYPRIDRTLRADSAQKIALRKKLGIADDMPVVLYAPTFRGDWGNDAYFDCDKLRSDITQLVELPCALVFRGHYHIEHKLATMHLPVIIAGTEIDASELLAITDILITDYSSILFDFLPAKRPVLLYAYDHEKYTQERGMYFSMDEMPGELHFHIDSLKKAVEKHLAKDFVPDGKHLKALDEFCYLDDGQASKRVVDFFFNDTHDNTLTRYVRKRTQPSYLFNMGPFLPNGITASFLNLTKALTAADHDVAVLVNPPDIARDEQCLNKFSQLSKNIAAIGRNMSGMLLSPSEKWLMDNQHRFDDGKSETMSLQLECIYKREFRRVFGYAEFASVIDFDGYSPYGASLCAAALPETCVKSMYLHNAMLQEATVRFPHLYRVFTLYSKFDHLVSVSLGVCEENKNTLCRKYSVDPDKFITCFNTINHEEIVQKAAEELPSDLTHWLADRPYFLSAGRLSVEKDYQKLIRAFTKIHPEYPESALLIIGRGPLESELQKTIESLGMQRHIKLGGLRENPFAIMRNAACLVLSSNHEGQPMVLLEAMTLHIPIIATDIPGSRSVIENSYGLLVDNSEQGLADGLRQFLAGQVRAGSFDATRYNQAALKSFFQLTTHNQLPVGTA